MPSDPRAVEARRQHRLAEAADASAGRHREHRDRLIRALRDDDWTYAEIARAVSCSPELVAHVVKRKQ